MLQDTSDLHFIDSERTGEAASMPHPDCTAAAREILALTWAMQGALWSPDHLQRPPSAEPWLPPPSLSF